MAESLVLSWHHRRADGRGVTPYGPLVNAVLF